MKASWDVNESINQMRLKVTPHDFDPVTTSTVPLYGRYGSIVYILISKGLHNNQVKSDFKQTSRVSYDSAEYLNDGLLTQ